MIDDTFSDRSDQTSGINSFFAKNLMDTLSADTYFTLNPQALSSLDILPKLKPDGTIDNSSVGGSSRSDTTVYSVLNKCRTASGQRLLACWMQNPLKCKEKIDLRLDIVQHFVDNNELRSMCYDEYLRKVPDLLRLAFKIHKEKCNLVDLMKVFTTCKSFRTLCNSFQQVLVVSCIEAPEAVSKLFNWCQKSCQELGEFMELIENSIDVDSVDESGEYMIKPDSDDNIAQISLELSTLTTQARKLLQEAAEDIELEADKGIKLEIDAEKGFALKVTKNNEQAVRGNPNYEQLSLVKKDGYRFTNRRLTKLSSKYVNAKEEYNSLAKNVIRDIISKAVMYDSEVLELTMSVTMIDVFVALAIAACQNNYVRPLVLDMEAGRISIEKLRHPCAENQPDIENYVPNSISFNKDDKKFHIITGPNMGGKSTFIKSVAVGVIMAQCGSLIPASDARISLVDGVYTRVGAGDNQMEGVSTFMEEMMDMSTILKSATENSLVIIDELGRGTSTFDGFGLAWSISKHLAIDTKSYTLFATHFHELTEMEAEIPAVGNLHVKALCQADKLTLLYDIAEGVCDESYGIHVARYTQFPQHVIESAKEKLKQFEEVPGFSDKKEVRNFVRECVKELLARSN